ncbi:hypothetical protein [Rhodococcoides kyotonense]|uniref:Chain length determinant protein n=1 Tax=Rhodococcoides kyotonense TaxID=398843 RepID=A0A239HBU5_9NOCA|nr:hypothetical protein [Rhodococcus kyotonensis]SNS78253.1 hypothetical protein SAMN05421642_105166 [Rhodococcus kyotonensis]
MAPVDDAVHRGDVPPPIDLAGHMRELGRALLPAFVIALIVGAAVFYVRSELTEKQYSASIVTEIKPAQTLIPGDAFIEQMRAPFTELSTDTDVLNRVLSEVDTDMDAAQLSANVELVPGTSPALLTYTVTADSADTALALAQSMVTTVAQAANANYARDTQGSVEQAQASIAAAEARVDALAADDPNRSTAQSELTELQQQLSQLQSGGGDQLVVLSSPEQNTAPVSPKPMSEALVAALAAWIIAAELIVLLRGRFGSAPNRSWARRVAKKNGAAFDAAVTGDLPPVLAARIDALHRESSAPASNARHAASKRDSVVVVLVGDEAVYRPTHGYAAEAAQGRPVVITMGLTDEWWRAVDVADIDTVAVLLSKAGRDRKAAGRTLKQIHEFGISSFLVLQPKNRKTKPDKTTPKQNAEVESGAN